MADDSSLTTWARAGCAGSNYTFLTQKERDNETGLDYFGARYYASTQGRFTSADDFWKDSQVSNPQSWNKYAYARNNPLKYVDPSGEKATVEIQTDEEHKKVTIKVTASIALWTNKDSKLSKADLQKAAASYKKQIGQGWSGQVQKNGMTVTVETTVNIQTYDSQSDAQGSRAQNVIEVTNGPVSASDDSQSGRDGLFTSSDTGRWNNQSRFAAHEFGHLLGIDDRQTGPSLMSEDNYDLVQKANADDYGWAFNSAIASHRQESRVPNPVSLGILNRAPAANGFGPPRSYNSSRELRFPFAGWWLR